jgi:hypothetical protein
VAPSGSVRNALARFDQVEGVSDAERAAAFANIEKAAKHYGVDVSEEAWQELGHHPRTATKSSTKPATKSSGKPATKKASARPARKKTAGARAPKTKTKTKTKAQTKTKKRARRRAGERSHLDDLERRRVAIGASEESRPVADGPLVGGPRGHAR